MYILKKLNREKNVSTETERKALLAEGWEDVTPSQADRLAKVISDAFSKTEKPDEEPPAGDGKLDEEPPAGDGKPDEEPPARDGKPDEEPPAGDGKPDEEPPAGDDGEKADEKPRRGRQK